MPEKETEKKQKRSNNRNNKRKKELQRFIIAVAVLFIIVILGTVVLVKKYAPTKETMPLSELYVTQAPDDAVVILNGDYRELSEEEAYIPNGLIKSGAAYLYLDFLKDNLDDTYFYDNEENILRYVTDKDVITATLGNAEYTINKDAASINSPVVINEYGEPFIALDFIIQYTDINYEIESDPNRILIEKAGWEKNISTLRGDVAIRRYGGVKSKILKQGLKNDKVAVLENYGKWSKIITEDGVIGCVPNKRLTEAKTEEVPSHIVEREYNHILSDKTVVLAWQQMETAKGNSSIDSILAKDTGITVMSPTWFALSDNLGGIRSFADMDYVNKCHSAGVQVWALCSNLLVDGTSSNEILNVTSNRDNLVNNILAQTIAYGIDGINIDFESLTPTAADGYIEFIRELSLRCEANNIVLSVDNYVPAAYNSFYNRPEQAKFADYVIMMGYDEHYGGSETAGPNASLPYVKEGIEDMLEDVPAEQTILGMPFYMRIWTEDVNGNLSQQAMGMNKIDDYLVEHNAIRNWKDDLGLNYAEFLNEDKSVTKAWIEDEKSLEEKLNLIPTNKLGGAAFWKLGFETDSVWNLVKRYTK